MKLSVPISFFSSYIDAYNFFLSHLIFRIILNLLARYLNFFFNFQVLRFCEPYIQQGKGHDRKDIKISISHQNSYGLYKFQSSYAKDLQNLDACIRPMTNFGALSNYYTTLQYSTPSKHSQPHLHNVQYMSFSLAILIMIYESL